MKLFITFLITILIIVIGLCFGAQNTALVTINYLIAKGTYSLASIITVASIIGFIMGASIFIASNIKLRLKYLKLIRHHKKLLHRTNKANQ